MPDNNDITSRTFTLPDGTPYTIGDAGAHRDLSPEKLEEARKNQEKWASQASSPFTAATPQMAAYLRSVKILPELLERYSHSPSDLLELQISECYATQGDYESAFSWTNEPARKAQYAAMDHAINRPDDEDCGPDCDAAFAANAALFTKDTLAAWQFDPRFGQIRPVIRCATCGSLNVKPMTDALVKQRALRAKAQEMTKGLSPTQARQAMVAAKLTPADVFKS